MEEQKIDRNQYIIAKLSKQVSELNTRILDYEFELLALKEKLDSYEKAEKEE